jgi:hypothetical protein
MSVILCSQSDVLGEGCPGCGDWLHRVVRGGFPHNGWHYCDQECIADYEESRARSHVAAHTGTRDLLCDCADICAPRGLPTAAMRQEYADYLATLVDGRGPVDLS